MPSFSLSSFLRGPSESCLYRLSQTHTHCGAFNHKPALYTMSTIFKACVMELIIECAMLMQNIPWSSHAFCILFLEYWLKKREMASVMKGHLSVNGVYTKPHVKVW